MVKHIVVWRLKDVSKENDKIYNAKIIKNKLESLNGKIPGLLLLEVGINFTEDSSSSDIVLYSEFATKSDLENYQKHPLHLEAASFVREVNCERRVADYEI